jgi:hypothetical protein
VVARAERHAHEREIALDGDGGDAGNRPVPARDAQDVRVRGTRYVRRALSVGEDVRLDLALARRRHELVPAGAFVAGARVDDEEPGHKARIVIDGSRGPGNEPFGPWCRPVPEPIVTRMSERGFHRIEDDLNETWLEDWAGAGVAEIEAYLAKHAAFQAFLGTDDV